MSDTPLYDATLAEQLRLSRREGERARTRWTLAERAAGERVAEVERAARIRVAAAERRVAELERTLVRVERQARLRQALVEEAAEARWRAETPARVIDLDAEPPSERQAPPVPSVAELLRPSPGVTRFLDALLGPADRR